MLLSSSYTALYLKYASSKESLSSQRYIIFHYTCHKYFSMQHIKDKFLRDLLMLSQVTDPWFAVFAFVYVSTQVQHLVEVVSGEGSVAMWWDEQRIWILKSVTSIFAILEALKKRLGLNKVKFSLSNKAIDKEKLKKYEEGRFDFQGAAVFMAPLVVLLIINIVAFFGGIWRVLNVKNFEEMFGQLFLVTYVMVLSFPILQAIVTMKSKSG